MRYRLVTYLPTKTQRRAAIPGVTARRTTLPRFAARAALAALPLLAACTPTSRARPDAPAAFRAFENDRTGQISVHSSDDKPIVTTVARAGDPTGAVAASVLTDGDPIASTALAAVMESRLLQVGVTTVKTRADRDGYRVFALVATPAQATAFVRSLHDAMSAPITAPSPAIDLAARRLAALRANPLDSPALLPIVQCTGELGALPSDAWLDPTTPAGAARLEELRRLSHVRERTSLAAVGPATITEAFLNTVRSGPAWESGSLPQDPWPTQNRITAYAQAGSVDAPPTLQIALRVRGAFTATAVAERAARPDSPLLARVNATNGWQVSRISATVRPRGACLSVVLDRSGASDSSNLETDAARVAALVANELETAFSEVRSDGSVAGRQVLRASDPREAASLAAWWSQTSRLEAGPDRFAMALGLPPPRLVPDAPADAVDKLASVAGQRFASAYAAAHQAWDKPVADARSAVETGQGELWMLAASPCGVLAETPAESGVTSLAAIAAAQPSLTPDGVTLEPWVAQDGVGIFAHAPPRPGEGPHSLARRVADAAAHALVHQRITETDLASARAAALSFIDPPDAPFSAPISAFARVLEPDHPSWLIPSGLRGPIVEAASASVDLRWAALADGPIRLAVLANVDTSQADTAVRSLDRWLVRTDESSHTCSPVPPAAPTSGQTVSLEGDQPRALVGTLLSMPDAPTLTMLELLANGLNGHEGWLSKSFASFGHVSATARVLGGSRAAALIIDIRGPDAQLDAALLQARATLDRLARGAATADDLSRARARLDARDLEASLDPRVRLLALWRGQPFRREAISLDAWNAWMSRTLAADNLSSLRSKVDASAVSPPADDTK